MRVIHRPHFIRTRRKRQRHSRFGAKSLAPPTLHRQPFLPVQPIHSLVVDPPPKRSVLGLLPSQENIQPPIAESRTLGCQLAQPSPQRRFVPFSALVTPAPAVHPDQPTGASLAGLPLFCQHHLQRVEVQRLLRHDLLQPPVLFLQLTQPPGLVHFHAPVLRLPVVKRGITNADPAAEVFHWDSGLRLFQHPDDLLFTKPAPFHDASPLVVLYPEKLSIGWTKFRGAGHDDNAFP